MPAEEKSRKRYEGVMVVPGRKILHKTEQKVVNCSNKFDFKRYWHDKQG